MTITDVPFWQDLKWEQVTLRLLMLAVTWLLVWLVVRFIGRWLLRLIAESRGFTDDDAGFTMLRRVLRGLVIVVGALSTLAILGLTPLLASTLTSFGIAGIIVGLAVKDVAANFVSGVLLLFDRPFALGDYVSAGNVEGTVEHISLRSTRIRTPEGPVVTVPNSIIAANAISNFSMSRARRVELPWRLPIGADIDAVSAALIDLAGADERVVAEPPPQVLVGDVRASFLDLVLVVYVRPEGWLVTRSDLRRELAARLAEMKASQRNGSQ